MSHETLPDLHALRQHCMLKDQRRLRKRIADFDKKVPDYKRASEAEKLIALYEEARCRLAQRLARAPSIVYPEGLPVSERADEIVRLLNTNQVIIVAGETGSGKTTQLPKICLEAGLGRFGMIGHTQPRRLAARSVSTRLAEELRVELGEEVGYQVRFTDQVSDNTLVKVMTDGILLTEVKHDPFLNKYDCIIIDEAHERSLNIDFLLGYLKRLLTKRKDLKLVITSATIDVERFSEHFNGAPIVKVEGRSYPVDIQYCPPHEQGDEAQTRLPEQITQTLEQVMVDERSKGWGIGDVLVFLPGEREIRETAKHLRMQEWRDTEITPLYARLSAAEQQKIFSRHRGRRIVLATNVAETSITVPGIRYVIDPGVARISRYSVRSKLQRLPVEAISQASANQRAGRCGRVAEGICYRLYSEDDFLGRPEFTDAEILRTNLAAVILKMLDLGLGKNVKSFPFIDPPDSRLWNDGFKLLYELGAVDDKQQLTGLGKQLSQLPVDPRLGRMIIEANRLGSLHEVLVIVSALSVQDPRERPAEKQQAADQAHAEYKDQDSDFVSLLNLWKRFEDERQSLGSNQLKRFCQKSFLSFLRMREWRELHRQLLISAKGLGFRPSSESSNYERLHQSLLSGLLGHVGHHDEQRDYKGCRNRKFQLFPGSAIAKKRPKWVMAAELVETSQVFARYCARIEPGWIEPLATHLVKKTWSEPHWQKKRGQVLAYEKVTLYGLEIVARRLVNYSNINHVEARDIFIRSALVEGDYAPRIAEIRDNRALINELEAIEDRTRKRDILVDDETIFQLYDEALPQHITSAASLEKWYKGLDAGQKKALAFQRESLTREAAPDFDPSLFPDHLENNGIRFPLSYHFKPGEQQDGVTVSIPVSAARQLSAGRVERLVPGLLREKCTQLIKQLPRTLRKHFVPVPDTLEKIMPELEQSEDNLLEALSRVLNRHTGVNVPYETWRPELLEDHLRFNLAILDDDGRVIEQGRDFVSLVTKVEHLIDAAPKSLALDAQVKTFTDWDFGKLPETEEVKQAGIIMRMYPALEDRINHVEKTLVSNEENAHRLSRLGVARLFCLRLGEQLGLLEKSSSELKQMGLYFAPLGQAKTLYNDFFLAVCAQHFTSDGVMPRSKGEFESRWHDKRGSFVAAAEEFASLCLEILRAHHALMKRLKGKMNLNLALPMADLQHQLSQLVYSGFLSNTPREHLLSYPRYLQAALLRLEKMPREMGNEREYVPQLSEWWKRYEERKSLLETQGIFDPELERFRWMLEEQRVSWYAQQLGTSQTISPKRVNRQWECVRKA